MASCYCEIIAVIELSIRKQLYSIVVLYSYIYAFAEYSYQREMVSLQVDFQRMS